MNMRPFFFLLQTIAPPSTSETPTGKNRVSSPPFGDTSESIQNGIAHSAGVLLELNTRHRSSPSMTTHGESHERSVSSSSSDCSSSDSSASNEDQRTTRKVDSETNIPYEKLINDDDGDEVDPPVEQPPKQPVSESTILLNKTLPPTYGTQSLSATSSYERSKCVSNNGYNSHGSSITTKSSSDNSGSVRTNSGSDNDEESDEEHYNNSTLAKPVSGLSEFDAFHIELY